MATSPGEKNASSGLHFALLGGSLLLNLGLFGFLCAQAAHVNRLSAQIEKLLAVDAHLARFGARIDSLSAQYQAFAKVFARSSARNAPYMPALDMLLYEQGAWFVQMTLERALKKMLNVYHTRPSARHQSTSEDSDDLADSDDPAGSDDPDGDDNSRASSGTSGGTSESDNEPGGGSEHSPENAKRPTISASPAPATSPGPERRSAAAPSRQKNEIVRHSQNSQNSQGAPIQNFVLPPYVRSARSAREADVPRASDSR